jgi:hypothetical protein
MRYNRNRSREDLERAARAEEGLQAKKAVTDAILKAYDEMVVHKTTRAHLENLYEDPYTVGYSSSVTAGSTSKPTVGSMHIYTSPISGGVYATTGTVSGSSAAQLQDWNPPPPPVTKEDLEEMKQEIIQEVCVFLENWLNERENAD